MRIVFFYILLSMCSYWTLAQSGIGIDLSTGMDTIRTTDKFFYKPKLVLGLGGHNSFVAGEKVKIGGLRIGLEFKRRWRFGFGLNGLNKPLLRGGTEQAPIEHRIDFAYSSIFGEYIILNNKRWEVSFPLVFGAGATTVSSRVNEEDLFVPERGVPLRVRQLSAVGYYKVWRWLGIGASVGYRDVTSSAKHDPELAKIVTKAFDGPNWAIKTKIYLGELWRAIFKKKDKKKKSKTIDRGEMDSM